MKIVRMLRDARAVSAVEFALTAPLFFALLFGMIEGGLLVWTQIGLQHGAEAAARCASIKLCGTTTDIQNYAAKNAFGLSVDPSTFTVLLSPPPGCNQVSASYAFGFVTSYFGVPSLTLNAQSCFPK